MAKIGEGDARWLVKEREDGANCNNWHWTTTDVSSHTKQSLSAGVQGDIFPRDGPLAHCRIKSAETTGEASVNNRKGRTFLIYELEMKLKWEGELRDEEGAVLESTKGTIKLTDVSAESLDDLDFEFTSNTRGSALSEAMRKQGVRCVQCAVQQCIKRLQDEITENASKPKAAGPAPVRAPMPQPIKMDAAAAAKPKPPPRNSSSASPFVDSDEEEELRSERPPAPMTAAMKKLKDSPATALHLRLSNYAIRDVHLRPLIEAMQHSQCALEEVDLSFNRLTDAGINVLFRAIHAGAALELTRLYLGGNKTTPAGMALSQHLKTARPELLVVWKNELPAGKSMCTVGTVYMSSPANEAGLLTGDSIIAFGPVQFLDYKGVSESIVPVVKANVDRPIDVVVARMSTQGAQVAQIAMTLSPKKWSGAGLLGCILK